MENKVINFPTLESDECRDFERIAALWHNVLGRDIKPEQVALCLLQMHVSDLMDNPEDHLKPLMIARAAFDYEAILAEKNAK